MRSPLAFRTACSVTVVGALCGLFGCKASDHDEYQPSTVAATITQEPAAASGLVDLDGRSFSLQGMQPSPITVVVFTRTDCPISNRFAPEVRSLYEAYHPRGVEFFLVYVDPHEEAEAIRRHLRDYRYPCPGLRDPKHALVKQCGATITPEAVVFDKQGEIMYLGRISDLYVQLGQARTAATTHDLADAIEATVAGKPVAVPRAPAVGCIIADLDR